MSAAEDAVALAIRNAGCPGYTLGTYRWSLGHLLRKLGRSEAAEKQYREILSDAGSLTYDCRAAHEGLAWCAIDRGQSGAARREAEAAVRLAEEMGDEALGPALEVLVAACRAAEDLPAARRAAEQRVKGARRVGIDYDLYFALRGATDVALDEGRTAEAHALLEEAAPLAELLDQQSGLNEKRAEIAQRRERLARMEAKP